MKFQPYYWTNPLFDKFEITIESILEANGNFYVRISEMVVKPSGGGQAGDRGVIIIDGQEYPFIDTVVQEEKPVLVVKKPPKRKSRCNLRIDMEWRKNMMTNHTSEHIFVGALKKEYPDLDLGKIWIDGLHGTVMLTGAHLSFQDIMHAESEVAKLIQEELEVTTKIVRAEDVDESIRAREGLTSKHDTIRLVKVGTYDSSACSGAHVTNTKDIGIFKVIDIKIEENETHVEFISGPRAATMLRNVYNEVLVRRHDYPFEIDQLGAVLDKSKSVQVAYDHAIEKILQLLKEGPQKEKVGDIIFWHEFLPGLDSSIVKHLLKDLDLKSPSITLLFAPGKKTNFTLWTKGMPKDAAHYITEVVKLLGGKGGGSGESYTGGFTETSDPELLFNSIVKSIRGKLQQE